VPNPYSDVSVVGGRKLQASGRVYRGGGDRFIRGLTRRSQYIPIRTGRRRESTIRTKEFPDPPLSWTGTVPEWAIYWAFIALGMKEGQHFEYEYYTPATPNGVDFYVYDQHLIIEIFGLYWHYQLGREKLGSDLERQIRLESMGYSYIVIDEDDIMRAPTYYLKEALAGRDHSRLARGAI
jgi:very-short-patch-repair endonuclease